MYAALQEEMETQGLTQRSLILKAGLIYPTVQPKLAGRENVGDLTLIEAIKLKTALGSRKRLEDLFAEDAEKAERIS